MPAYGPWQVPPTVTYTRSQTEAVPSFFLTQNRSTTWHNRLRMWGWSGLPNPGTDPSAPVCAFNHALGFYYQSYDGYDGACVALHPWVGPINPDTAFFFNADVGAEFDPEPSGFGSFGWYDAKAAYMTEDFWLAGMANRAVYAVDVELAPGATDLEIELTDPVDFTSNWSDQAADIVSIEVKPRDDISNTRGITAGGEVNVLWYQVDPFEDPGSWGFFMHINDPDDWVNNSYWHRSTGGAPSPTGTLVADSTITGSGSTHSGWTTLATTTPEHYMIMFNAITSLQLTPDQAPAITSGSEAYAVNNVGLDFRVTLQPHRYRFIYPESTPIDIIRAGAQVRQRQVPR